jgi:hypothetical protein
MAPPAAASRPQLQKALARVMVEFGNLEKVHPTISKDIVSEMFARLAQDRGALSHPLPPEPASSGSRNRNAPAVVHGAGPPR